MRVRRERDRPGALHRFHASHRVASRGFYPEPHVVDGLTPSPRACTTSLKPSAKHASMSDPPILGRLEGLDKAHAQSGGWRARCPPTRTAALRLRGHVAMTVASCSSAWPAVTRKPWSRRWAARWATSSRRRPRPWCPTLIRRTKYLIRDADGQHVATHVRLDYSNGDKQCPWELPDGSKKLGELHVEDLPLFGSEKLRDWPADAPIVVTEGEKAAAALVAAGIPALGTVTGADVQGKAPNVGPLAVLRGRTVLLWPDNDAPGLAHMTTIAKRLGVERGRSVGADFLTVSQELGRSRRDSGHGISAPCWRLRSRRRFIHPNPHRVRMEETRCPSRRPARSPTRSPKRSTGRGRATSRPAHHGARRPHQGGGQDDPADERLPRRPGRAADDGPTDQQDARRLPHRAARHEPA